MNIKTAVVMATNIIAKVVDLVDPGDSISLANRDEYEYALSNVLLEHLKLDLYEKLTPENQELICQSFADILAKFIPHYPTTYYITERDESLNMFAQVKSFRTAEGVQYNKRRNGDLTITDSLALPETLLGDSYTLAKKLDEIIQRTNFFLLLPQTLLTLHRCNPQTYIQLLPMDVLKLMTNLALGQDSSIFYKKEKEPRRCMIL